VNLVDVEARPIGGDEQVLAAPLVDRVVHGVRRDRRSVSRPR
jgi:hypothetical protein